MRIGWLWWRWWWYRGWWPSLSWIVTTTATDNRRIRWSGCVGRRRRQRGLRYETQRWWRIRCRWRVHNRWIRIRWKRTDRRVGFRLNRINDTATTDRDELHVVQRQPVTEGTEVYPIDGQLVLGRFGQNEQIETFAYPDRTATVTLLGTDHLPLDRITPDHELMRPDTDVQRTVIPRVQCGTGLQMNLAALAVILNDALDTDHAARL
uniref:Putative secreted protein n=1 Tax=Anopheles darlingi TaxID=43151 RepID=A0A2M4CZZ3_ANODA